MRNKTIDHVKAFACILVVLGHFLQSMVKSSIIEDSVFLDYMLKTVYCFHVPLFFICSGYLYQKYTEVSNIQQWGENIFKKLINLGIPYAVFSCATWILKTLASGEVNTAVDSLGKCLFSAPLSPYWYLYSLFFIFMAVPTLRSRRGAWIALCGALIARFLSPFCFKGIYAVSTVLKNAVWVIGGMCIVKLNWQFRKNTGILMLIASVAFSILAYRGDFGRAFLQLCIGVTACCAVITFFRFHHDNPVMDLISRYTMPVFLMHTIVAAPVRIILLKVGCSNALLHFSAGIAASFLGPAVIMKIMEKIKYMDFLVYPGKYIRIGKGRNPQAD